MTPRPRHAGWLGIAAGLSVVASCSPKTGAADSRQAVPRDPPVVVVTVTEYRFDYERFPRGRVVVRLRNAGTMEHRLSLIPLPEEFPPLDVQLRGEERRFVDTLAGTAPVPPQGAGTFAVDLQPGRYAIVCLLSGADGETHARKGEASEFRVS